MLLPRSALLTGLLVSLAAPSLRAQASIAGTVTDAMTGRPISDAQVFFGNRTVPTVTNQFGKYRLDSLAPGRRWLLVRRIGYAPARRSLTVEGNTTIDLNIGLDPLPLTLPDVEVQAQSGFGVRRLQDFWRRYSTAWGRFTTRDDVERFGGAWLSTLVRMYLPRAPVTRSEVDAYYDTHTNGFSQITTSTPGFAALGQCPPAVSIDGSTPWGLQYVDDVYPSQVEAMEIYKPGLRVPIEFAFYAQALSCGLVVIWLR